MLVIPTAGFFLSVERYEGDGSVLFLGAWMCSILRNQSPYGVAMAAVPFASNGSTRSLPS